jgi:hypothetical protein
MWQMSLFVILRPNGYIWKQNYIHVSNNIYIQLEINPTIAAKNSTFSDCEPK